MASSGPLSGGSANSPTEYRTFPALEGARTIGHPNQRGAGNSQRDRAGGDAVTHISGAKLGVVISGGAPTLHIAARALSAFYEKHVKFDVVACSGAGALPGLLYLAPKSGHPIAALKGVVNLNIHDAIYDLIPNNYKVFFKYGPFSDIFYRLGHMLPHFPADQ